MMRQLFVLAALAASTFQLSAEAPYAFRERLECVHERGLRDVLAVSDADEFVVADGFSIAVPDSATVFEKRVASDFVDFLDTSMDVRAAVVRSGSKASLTYVIDAGLAEREYRITTGKNGIVIEARDERALAQAFYHLEDVMSLRRAPFVKFGQERRIPRFAVRMTHSGYGNDIFPEAHLAKMAHLGMTAILVFLDDIDKTKAQDYQDIKALIRLAAKYGLDTYLYSYIEAFAHPDDGAKVFDESYGRIAGFYPEAKGIILVGESCQFPSKDPRVQPRTAYTRDPKDPRPLAGWFPCSDYPEWLKAVQNAISKHAPKQELVFWTYNWGWAPYEDRMKLIDSLPSDVTLMATFEMFETRKLRNGIEAEVADYSLSFVGPGKYFTSEAERAKKNNLKLYTQANAGGLTWDFGTIAYEPFPFQWVKRWQELNRAHDNWGLSGIMENHHYGWWPSFISELEKETYTEGGMAFENHLRKILARDFGAANVDGALDIFRKWSATIEDIVPTEINQYGTFRIGAAYPFAFGTNAIKNIKRPGKLKVKECAFPETRYASNFVCKWMCRLDYLSKELIPDETSKERDDDEYFNKEIELFEPMAACYEEGEAYFKAIAERLVGRQKAKAIEMANLGGYLATSVRTAINVKRGAMAFRKGDNQLFMAAAKAEYANATKALEYVEADSRLGWEPSMEYAGGPVQIRWKLDMMEKLYGKENLK